MIKDYLVLVNSSELICPDFFCLFKKKTFDIVTCYTQSICADFSGKFQITCKIDTFGISGDLDFCNITCSRNLYGEETGTEN